MIYGGDCLFKKFAFYLFTISTGFLIYVFIARYIMYGTNADIPRFSELIGLFTGYNAQGIFSDYRELSTIFTNISNTMDSYLIDSWQFKDVGFLDIQSALENIGIGVSSLFNTLNAILSIIIDLVKLLGTFLSFIFNDILGVISIILNWLFAN